MPETLLSLTGKRWDVARDLRPLAGGDQDRLAALLAETREIDPSADGDGPCGMDGTLLPDMEEAARLIDRALAGRGEIGIVGDYDCDGITATAILLRFFHRRGRDPRVVLPDRARDGYGLKLRHVEELRSAGAELLLTADTGISCAAEIRAARACGMDVIVLDHHHAPPVLPPASALLHPGVAGLPGPHPSAAGVAWSAIRALEERDGARMWDDWQTDLALAMLGTVADLVELRGGNRTLVAAGLEALRAMEEGPLADLCRQAGVGADCTSRDVAFRLAPRINAAGRMADPAIALRALLGDREAMRALDGFNRDRQEIVLVLLESIQADAAALEGPFLCLAREDVLPGVAGLIAGKLAETYGRPALVASVQGATCTASLRGAEGYHVTEALGRCGDLLMNFGGHARAAGCTFARSSFAELRKRLCADVLARIDSDSLVPSVAVDTPLDLAHVTVGFCRSLSALEPFGQGNPEPRFLLEDVELEDTRGVGRDGAHLQARIVDGGNCKVIGFGLGKLAPVLKEPVDLVCRVGLDAWQGKISPQLFVEDVRVTGLVRSCAHTDLTPAPASLPSGTPR